SSNAKSFALRTEVSATARARRRNTHRTFLRNRWTCPRVRSARRAPKEAQGAWRRLIRVLRPDDGLLSADRIDGLVQAKSVGGARTPRSSTWPTRGAVRGVRQTRDGGISRDGANRIAARCRRGTSPHPRAHPPHKESVMHAVGWTARVVAGAAIAIF